MAADEANELVPTLTVRDGSGTVQRVLVGAAPISIGRALSCTIRLTNTHVARHHALIEVRDHRLVFIDLGGANGSWLKGRRIRGAVHLHVGDVITIADAELAYEVIRTAHG